MSGNDPTTAVADSDEIDMVAAFLMLFGPEPEDEPQPAAIIWTPPAPVQWTPGGFLLGETQLNATTEPPGLGLVYDPPAGERLGVGTRTLTVSLAAGQNYAAEPKQVALAVGKLPARIVWKQPEPLTWQPGGVTVGWTQLDATTDPPGGRIDYVHKTEGKLPPGNHPITARIAEGEPYEADPVTQTITVNRAPATIKWDVPAEVAWTPPGGFVISEAQLNATTDPPDLKLVYSGHDGGKAVGSHALTATLDDLNYEAEPKTVTLTVKKAPATIKWDAPAQVSWMPGGFVVNEAQLNATTDPPDLKLVYAGHDGGKEVGSHTVTATLDETNYEAEPKNVTLTVAKADPRLAWKKASGSFTWKENLTVNANFASNLDNPLKLEIAFNPTIGTPLAIGPNPISVTAADAAHYDQTPQVFTLTIKRASAKIGLIREIEVPADAESSWTVDVTAVEARTTPPGLALVYDPPNGQQIYAGNAGITVSLDPSVTTHEAEDAWSKVKLVFPPKAQPGDNDEVTGDGDAIVIPKGVLRREYPYGGPNVTPHIHQYGTSFHIKLAGGHRLNLVQGGTLYPDNVAAARNACAGNARLVAIINALVKPYE